MSSPVALMLGFETGDLSEVAGYSTTGSAPSGHPIVGVQSSVVHTITGQGGNYALRVNPQGSGTATIPLLGTASGGPVAALGGGYYYSIYFRFSSANTFGDTAILGVQGSTTDDGEYLCAGLFVSYSGGASGSFKKLQAGGTVILTTITPDAWHQVGVYLPAPGSGLKYWLDGTLLDSGTTYLADPNSRDGSPVTIDAVTFGKPADPSGTYSAGTSTVDFYFDDICVRTDAIAGAGICSAPFLPSADGTYPTNASWLGSPSTGANSYQDVNAVPPSSSSYVKCTATSGTNKRSFTTSGTAITGTVACVKALALIADPAAGTSNIGPLCRTVTAESNAATAASWPATATPSALYLTTDPSNGSAWTASAVAAAQIGLAETGSAAARCSSLSISAYYLPGAAVASFGPASSEADGFASLSGNAPVASFGPATGERDGYPVAVGSGAIASYGPASSEADGFGPILATAAVASYGARTSEIDGYSIAVGSAPVAGYGPASAEVDGFGAILATATATAYGPPTGEMDGFASFLITVPVAAYGGPSLASPGWSAQAGTASAAIPGPPSAESDGWATASGAATATATGPGSAESDGWGTFLITVPIVAYGAASAESDGWATAVAVAASSAQSAYGPASSESDGWAAIVAVATTAAGSAFGPASSAAGGWSASAVSAAIAVGGIGSAESEGWAVAIITGIFASSSATGPSGRMMPGYFSATASAGISAQGPASSLVPGWANLSRPTPFPTHPRTTPGPATGRPDWAWTASVGAGPSPSRTKAASAGVDWAWTTAVDH